MSRFLAALQFLTVIPIPWNNRVQEAHVERAAGYFPIVGLIIGIIMAVLSWLLRFILPLEIANAILLVILVILSGGLHLDGFADTCDGLASHKTVDERWRIMHDGRVGSYGVIGIMLLLIVKYVSINSIPETIILITWVIMPVVSRWAMVYAIYFFPYARSSGLGKIIKQGTGFSEFIMATLITIAVGVILDWLVGLVVIITIWVITLALAASLRNKFAGLTGDNYGAINEVTEVGVLIMIHVIVGLGLI
ncbi:adenosylcobinamide-GDP ribazoletransferase [Chloroflexota bacterium]